MGGKSESEIAENHITQNRVLKAHRFVKKLCAAGKIKKLSPKSIEIGIHKGTLDLKAVAKIIGEQPPSAETTKEIIRLLRMLRDCS